MVSNQCTIFQKNPCTHLLEHVWTKSCPQTGIKKTARRTDRRTDRVKPIYPPKPSFVEGIKTMFVRGIIISCITEWCKFLLKIYAILTGINIDWFLDLLFCAFIFSHASINTFTDVFTTIFPSLVLYVSHAFVLAEICAYINLMFRMLQTNKKL